MKKTLGSNTEYVRAGLCWDASNKAMNDLDISAFLLNKENKAVRDENFIFYNNPFSLNGALMYGGDNRSGVGDGFDETILMRMSLIPEDISRIVLCVTINEEENGLKFGDVLNAEFFVSSVVDAYDKGGNILASINLSKSFAKSSGIIAFEFVRSGSFWKFDTPCENVRGGMEELCYKFGLEVE